MLAYSVSVDQAPFQGFKGYVATWAFMFAARCGFIKDDEVPFGRLQPYVGVGPADVNVAFNIVSGVREHRRLPRAW